jgi:undecaprenyl-diphosphatase
MLAFLHQLDTRLFLFFNAVCANPVGDFIFPFVTDKHNWIIPAVLAIGWLAYSQRWRALTVIIAVCVTVAISDPLGFRVLKPLFGRLRPCHPDVLVEGGRFLLGHKTSLAFPSLHAMNTSAQAALLSFLYPGQKWYFISFAAVIGYSRVYTGVHYPGDVLAGAVFGVMVGAGVFVLYRSVRGKIPACLRPDER